MCLLTEDETQGHRSWRQAPALPTVTCPPTKVSFPLQCSFLLLGFMEGDSRGEKTGGGEAITINLRSSRTQTDSVWTGFCYWGWGAGPAGGGGPSGRLEPSAFRGWAPLGLQAGATAAGAPTPRKSHPRARWGAPLLA